MDKKKQTKIEAIILGIILLLMVLAYFPAIKEEPIGTIAYMLGQFFAIWIILKIGFWIFKKIKNKK